MNLKGITAATLAILALSAPALAANEMILLNPDDLSSRAVIDVTGNDNRLVIEQVSPGQGALNTVTVKIVGDRNGGPAGSLFTGVAARNGLAPGRIIQTGFGNSVALDITGDDNLVAVAQIGNNNTVRAAIAGYRNQSSVMQTGNGNFASIAQNGIGNSISVQQTAW